METNFQSRTQDHLCKMGENGANNSERYTKQCNDGEVPPSIITKAAALQIMPHLASVTVDLVVMAPLPFKLFICLATINSKATFKVLQKTFKPMIHT